MAGRGGAVFPPAMLAWVLSEVEIPGSAAVPAGVSAAELLAYLKALIRRLRQAAVPADRVTLAKLEAKP